MSKTKSESSIFFFKPSFKSLLNFDIIWFVIMTFFILILFQFSPTLAEKNCLLFYSGTLINSEITNTGWVIIIILILFFTVSLILGFLRNIYSFIFGAIAMILLSLFFYAGNFILFTNYI